MRVPGLMSNDNGNNIYHEMVHNMTYMYMRKFLLGLIHTGVSVMYMCCTCHKVVCEYMGITTPRPSTWCGLLLYTTQTGCVPALDMMIKSRERLILHTEN